MKQRREKVGLWMIGASGGVASTVALGLGALGTRRISSTGLVTESSLFPKVPLIDPASIVIGGHEIRSESLTEAVYGLHDRAQVFERGLIDACAPHLRACQRNILAGTLYGAHRAMRDLADGRSIPKDRSAAEAVERLSADIRAFRRRNRLDHVVVIHLASSEPPAAAKPALRRFAYLQRALARPGSRVLPPSSLYALAAVESGSAFINFTPSLGIEVPAIQERASSLGVPYMGRDGKTGESLVKSVLAPMFALRHLPVLSWVGQNILGNRDGAVLRDPRTRAAKIRSKDKIVPAIAGRRPVTGVSIDYVPSLDDWKVAWDFIHFEGFFGQKMTLQFTWQGADSILAAPLVIDLARLAALECRRGRHGPMRHLAYFFKDPMAVHEQNSFVQWQRLVEHVAHGSSEP